MSLHLIESRKTATGNSRKRGGIVTSILMHLVLILGVFTVATATPVVKVRHVDQGTTYVVPPPPAAPPAHRAAATAPPSTSAPAQTALADPAALPAMPITIATTIPDIVTGPPVDFSLGRARPGSTTGNTVEGRGTGDGAVGAVMEGPQVDRQVSIRSGYHTPRYPEALRAAGVEATIATQFVVDTLGRMEDGSLEILNTAHASFIAAVREALSSARFRPAEAGGHRVRQRVAQSFVFSLQRRD